MATTSKTLSYGERASRHPHAAAKQLLQLMEDKKTNLCVSLDVSNKSEFLQILEAVGPYICLVKTHIDIIEDFDQGFINALMECSNKHEFMIFEDRKFADIGNTAALQYSRGVYRIADWAHITNAHPVPGPSVIQGLASIGKPLGRGLLLLAEMSSKGSLAIGSYSEAAVRMAVEHQDFVMGFIAQKRSGLLNSENSGMSPDFLILTPGISLDAKGDSMGQQYRSPNMALVDADCDVIIVGRGIYSGGIDAAREQARRYQDEGWKAYLNKLERTV